VIEEGTADQRSAAVQTIAASASLRARRALVGRVARELGPEVRALASAQAPPPAGAQQAVYDAEHGGQSSLPGTLVRGSGDPPSGDESVDAVYDSAEATYNFYSQIYGRDSVDGQGLELISSVHFSRNFDNAFWNGTQMVYGDGSGHIFQPNALAKSRDVAGHEMTHAVTEYTAGLEYSSQSGALNESFSDVFGSLIKQYGLSQSADVADWLIGEGTLVPSLGAALRSLKAPGTAYSGDRQPATMADYVDLPDDGNPENDNGGVHINSGIPNHAFYLAATTIGGKAWEKAGKIWYQTLTGGHLNPQSKFKETAEATLVVATELFGEEAEHAAVAEAWQKVGVLP
jgi:Zn-dependent metalloprotease